MNTSLRINFLSKMLNKFKVYKTKDFYFFLINISFFLMLFVPTRFQLPRGVLLLIIGIYSIINFQKFKPKLAKNVFFSSLICLTYTVISLIIGLFNNNPGLIPSITTAFIWPMFFIWIISCNKDIKTIDNLMNVFVIGFLANTILIFLLIIFFVVNTNFLYLVEPFRKIFDFRASLYGSEIAFNLISMGSFVFANGYFFSRVYNFNSSTIINRKTKVINIILYILSTIVLLISGRRGFFIGSIFGALLIIYISHITKIKKISRHFFVNIFILLSLGISTFIIYLKINNIDLYTYFLEILQNFNLFNLESVSPKRYDDLINLTNIFKSSPFFGNGLGFSISPPTVITQQLFSYEIQYLQYLAGFGIIGFSVYGLYIFWIVYKCINLSIRDANFSYRLMPIISGLITFLVTNSTNPYLLKFDFLWVIFIPIGYINLLSMKK